MIGANLRAAVYERDPVAVGQLSLASTMTGIAFNMNANAIVHAASTPVTAHHGVPHGVANAIFMPAGLEFLRPACEEKLRDVAEALGEDVEALSPAAQPSAGWRPFASCSPPSSCLRRFVRAGSIPPNSTFRRSWRTP